MSRFVTSRSTGTTGRSQLSPQLVRLRPAPHCRTPILSYSQRITPSGHFLNWQQDPQSNYVARLTFPEKVEEFRVEIDLVAEMAVYNPFDFFLEPSAEHFPFSYEPSELRELQPFLHADPLTPRLARYLDVDRSPAPADHRLAGRASTATCSRTSAYVIRLDPGVQDVERTLELASGSCRDTTWLLVQLFRHLGLAARFVSGYLIQLVPDVKALDGPRGRRAATSPISTPGARSTCRAPAGSASIRRRDCWPAKGTSRWRARPSRSSAAPVSGGVEAVRGRVRSTRCRCSGSSNRRASPSPTPTRNGRRSSRAGARSTPTSPPATSA